VYDIDEGADVELYCVRFGGGTLIATEFLPERRSNGCMGGGSLGDALNVTLGLKLIVVKVSCDFNRQHKK